MFYSAARVIIVTTVSGKVVLAAPRSGLQAHERICWGLTIVGVWGWRTFIQFGARHSAKLVQCGQRDSFGN